MKEKLTHLGRIFHLTEEHEDIVDAILTRGSELSGGDALIFQSADFDVKGRAVLQRHEILSPDGIPERLRYYNILTRHKNMSIEQAHVYRELMLKAGFDYSQAISELDNMIRQKTVEETLSWLEMVALKMESCDVSIKDALHPSNGEESIPPTYGFHKVDDIYERELEPLWFDKQPHYVQRLITTPRRCKTIEQLKKLGKKCYESEKEENPTDYQKAYLSLTNQQQSVFWDQYNSRKKELMKVRELSDTAEGLIALIEKSDETYLPRTKATLVQIQKGQIRVRDPPTDLEWNIIWNHYKQREYEVNHPLPDVPEGYSRCGFCYEKGGIMYMPKVDLVTGKLPIYNNRWQKRLHCLDCTEFYSS